MTIVLANKTFVNTLTDGKIRVEGQQLGDVVPVEDLLHAVMRGVASQEKTTSQIEFKA